MPANEIVVRDPGGTEFTISTPRVWNMTAPIPRIHNLAGSDIKVSILGYRTSGEPRKVGHSFWLDRDFLVAKYLDHIRFLLEVVFPHEVVEADQPEFWMNFSETAPDLRSQYYDLGQAGYDEASGCFYYSFKNSYTEHKLILIDPESFFTELADSINTIIEQEQMQVQPF